MPPKGRANADAKHKPCRKGAFRNFLFTLNNFQNYPTWLEDFKSIPNVGYCIVGNEIGPQNGVPHYQGFIHFTEQISESKVRKFLFPAWCAVCSGTPEQNRAYCSKIEVLYTSGTFPQQGKRSDLLAVHEDIKAGKDFIDVYYDVNPCLP